MTFSVQNVISFSLQNVVHVVPSKMSFVGWVFFPSKFLPEDKLGLFLICHAPLPAVLHHSVLHTKNIPKRRKIFTLYTVHFDQNNDIDKIFAILFDQKN